MDKFWNKKLSVISRRKPKVYSLDDWFKTQKSNLVPLLHKEHIDRPKGQALH